jgi:hypothetical protein
MDHEALPDEHIEGPADYLVVFKGGPNHGLVLNGDHEHSPVEHASLGEGLLPEVGHRIFTRPLIQLVSTQAVGREDYEAALANIGERPANRATYEVESVADGVIVLASREES